MPLPFISPEDQKRIDDSYSNDPTQPVSMMAQELNLTEGQVTFGLPSEVTTWADGSHCQAILEELPEWGLVTTIVQSAASIFEVKANFPKGKIAHGFYNLMGKEGELHGHLRIDLVTDLAFVSKSFMKMDSYYIGFFDAQGTCVFKVYLGRNKKRELFPEQIERFKQLQQELS